MSEQTGHHGWVCATCFTASLSSPEDLLIQPGGSGAPVRLLASDPRLRVDEIPERKGQKLLDIGNGPDRHHPEVLELDELPFRWRNQSGAPSRVHHHQCTLCGGAQLVQADT